jgi:hypothetical protein
LSELSGEHDQVIAIGSSRGRGNVRNISYASRSQTLFTAAASLVLRVLSKTCNALALAHLPSDIAIKVLQIKMKKLTVIRVTWLRNTHQ